MDTEEYIQAQQLSNYCLLCDANLTIPHNALSHYSSRRHSERVKIFRNAYMQSWLNEKQKTASCDVCNVQFPEDEAAVHYEGDEHKRKEETYCKSCKITASSKTSLWQHFHGTKHKTKIVELGLPSDEVRYGPFDSNLPWKLKNEMLAELCKLCNAKLPTIKHAFEHYKTNNHSAKVRRWFKEKREISKSLTSSTQSLESNTTKKKESKAVTRISQSRTSQLFCKACDVLYSSEQELATHKCSVLHLENLKRPRNTTDNSETDSDWRPTPLWTFAKENLREQGHMGTVQTIYSTPMAQTNLVNNIPDKPTSSPSVENKNETRNEEIKIENENLNEIVETEKGNSYRDDLLTTEEIENKADLKKQIKEEIEKMIQTLYWSKTVPLEVALDYLRKVNKEVKELKKNYEKNTDGEEMSAQHENKEDDLKQKSPENGLSGSEILSTDEELHSFNSSQFLKENQNSSIASSNTTHDFDKYFDRVYLNLSSKGATKKSIHENPYHISDVPDEEQPYEPYLTNGSISSMGTIKNSFHENPYHISDVPDEERSFEPTASTSKSFHENLYHISDVPDEVQPFETTASTSKSFHENPYHISDEPDEVQPFETTASTSKSFHGNSYHISDVPDEEQPYEPYLTNDSIFSKGATKKSFYENPYHISDVPDEVQPFEPTASTSKSFYGNSYHISDATDEEQPYEPYLTNGSIHSNSVIKKSFHENPYHISDVPDEEQPFEPTASTSQKFDETKQNGLLVYESEDLETMFQQIVVLKNQVDDHLERDVLTEIEQLINLVNSDCIPPDQTLKCLQYFNRKLEGAKNDVARAKPEIKYGYSKEDLHSLRTEKTFLESFSSQLRATISQKGMWNKKKMDQMAWEGCTSLYDDFSDQNFVKFVETYLQGSLNNLSLQNSE